MEITLYDTYERKLRVFEPIEAGKVGLYACGPTVYNYAHIGNLRTYLFEDLLRRALEMAGYEVNHVINITDVGHLTSDADSGEDKMEKGARRTGETAWQIADKYAAAFKQDLAALNILPPSTWCRATDYIDEQIHDIAEIERKGFTYRTSDGIYFDTSKLDGYGYLARLDVAGLAAGSRVDTGEKRNPTDFALWKFSPRDQQRQMEWDSPWGTGFPGWHIECSAMSVKFLGKLFDIHCGGKDHIPVHHSNEIAQSEVCHDTRLANYWLHGYFLELDKAKMSKSAGEFLRLQSLVDRGYDPLAYRYLCLTASYRSDLKFTWESLDAAVTTLGRLRTAVHGLGAATERNREWLDRFQTHIADDLNAGSALAVLWGMLKSELDDGAKKATVLEMDKVLGLDLAAWQPAQTAVPEDVLALAEQRSQARKDRDFAAADALRDAVSARGYEIEDKADGFVVKPLK